MSMIKWVIQKTLAGEETLRQLTSAIVQNESEYELIEVIPFDTKVHYTGADHRTPIIYGSSTFMYGSLEHPYLKEGVFYDPATFLMSRYLMHWQDNMLNADGVVAAISEILKWDRADEEPFFVRPDSDSKSFAGMVFLFGDLKRRFGDLDGTNPYLDSNTKVLVSVVKEIEKEWRCFIVEGKVVSASRYRVYGSLSVDPGDVPDDMIDFCERMSRIYRPHAVFVMDAALYQGQYKVIECNCFNGSGTYQHDLVKIVEAVQDYVKKKL